MCRRLGRLCSLEPANGSPNVTPSNLNIVLPDDTSTMIINVQKSLTVGRDCTINVPNDGLTANGLPENVLINVAGKLVSIGRDTTVDPGIIAASGAISAGSNAQVGNLFGKNVTLKGAVSTTNLSCP